MLNLNSSIKEINRVGEATAKRLKNLGINTVQDALFYFPFRYDDFSKITPIKKLKTGQSANIIGTIELIQNRRSPRKRMNITEAIISDETETLKVIWFNQPFITRNLKIGDKISLAGKIESGYGDIIMKSPVYEKIAPELTPELIQEQTLHTQGLIPNYNLTANLTQKQLRFLISQILQLSDNLDDYIPKEIQKRQDLLSLSKAIKKIHFPANEEDVDKAKKRIGFDELFLIQLQSQLIRKEKQSQIAKKIKFKEKETKKFVENLPFVLTNSQKKSAWEIIKDIGKVIPMMRLLEGDVGCGKTIVACLAILNSSLNNKQSVLMAPTEILARQHFESISKIFKNYDFKIGLITSTEKKLTNEVKKISPKKIQKEAQIIIGTHALIQEKIEFKNLGLAIIDEQHRFGVEQRKKLIEKSGDKNSAPHLLSMTATPIPRSLALTIYGDLDISIINEMPVGRKQVITKIIDDYKRQKTYNFIDKQIKNGRQAFVICPLIDESDKLGAKSVKQEFEKLDKLIFPDLKIEMLHGKLKSCDKEKIMQDFLNKKINILVSTSVIEVGVDIPNASVMIIEGAERFGLAQLHQFRGRVGRSEYQSYCFLFTDSKSPDTLSRLNSMEKYNSGFDLANIDLKLRGPGEIYGINQKGFPKLKIANLGDYELTKKARIEAELIAKDIDKYPDLRDKLNDFNKAHLE